MNKSILSNVKEVIGGLDQTNTHFDPDLIMHINTAFMILNQLGVGPLKTFRIENTDATWDDFIPETDQNFEAIKSYIYLKVKQLFDPPSSSFVLDSMERQIRELEWRLEVQTDKEEVDILYYA